MCVCYCLFVYIPLLYVVYEFIIIIIIIIAALTPAHMTYTSNSADVYYHIQGAANKTTP